MTDPRLCACGSGLRAMRCCQLDPAMLPLAEAVRPLLPVVERAVELHRQDNPAEAEKLCLEVLELAPGQPDALSLLYRIRRAGGAERAAETLLRRIVALYPNTFWATNELTLVLLGKGAIAEAEIHARNAVRIAPENPQSHNLMGMIMTEANRPRVGEYHYRKVIELSGRRDPIVLANLAWNLKNQGRIAEARSLYEEASVAGPEVLQTLLGWARMEEADRNFERAAELLDRAEKLAPGNPSILLSRAVVLGRMQSYEQALALLDTIAGQNRDGGLGANELLEKGRLLDKMGRFGGGLCRLCRRQAAVPRGQRPRLSRRARPSARRALARVFYGDAAAHYAARRAPRGSAAADFYPRVSALRHNIGRADLVGPSANLGGRRAALCQRDHRVDAAHAEQPAGLSRGIGRAVDGRPLQRPRRIARLLSAACAAARHSRTGC